MGLLGVLDRRSPPLDVGLGLSALGWAAAGLMQALPEPSAPALALTAMHACAGLLFLRRNQAHGPTRLVHALTALPALVCAAAVWRLGPAPGDWPLWAGRWALLAALWTCWSLLTLGPCFGVLPAHRGLVTRGPYRWVRHPAYLGELLMLQAAAAASMKPILQGLAAAAALPILLRIHVEESVLAQDPGWPTYAAAVRWRLIPGIW